jgi:hypothetical protein
MEKLYSAVILRPLKKFEYAKEAAQIFVSGTRDVLRNTARSEEQKYAAKLTPADSNFLGESSIYAETPLAVSFFRRLRLDGHDWQRAICPGEGKDCLQNGRRLVQRRRSRLSGQKTEKNARRQERAPPPLGLKAILTPAFGF